MIESSISGEENVITIATSIDTQRVIDSKESEEHYKRKAKNAISEEHYKQKKAKNAIEFLKQKWQLINSERLQQ